MPPTAAERASARERARQRRHRRRSVGQVLLLLGAAIAAIPILVIAIGLWLLYSLKTEVDSAKTRPPTTDERAELRDGRQIVFSRSENVTALNDVVFVMNGDGSGLVRLTSGSAPSWSPDGSRIAFTRFAPRGGGWFAHFVFVMRADGSGARRLLPGRTPAWSPDGGRLLFVRDSGIWVMRSSGTGARRLHPGAQPVWSPDGRRMAFEHGGAVWVADVDGGPPMRLSPGADPAWSPDGERILFTIRQTGESLFGEYPTELALVDADGGRVRRLGRGAIFPSSIEDGEWSRDGEWVAFRCSVDEICVTRSDWDGDWLRVGRLDLGSQFDPDWQ